MVFTRFRKTFCIILASIASTEGNSFKSQITAALQPIADAYALHFNTSFSIGVANAENPTGFGIAAGINSHTDASRVSTESLYPVGSATKLYTAVAVLQAHERGLIDLDAPVAPVIDPFLQRTNGTTLFQLWQNDLINKVTARQLMGMRSGISDYDDQALNKFSLDANNWNEDITPYDYIHRWAIKKFLFAPGTGGAYTSIGYELLGFLLAAVNNVTTWQSYDQKSIFPAELRSKLPHMIFAGPGKCSSNAQIVHQYSPIIEQVSSWTAINFIDIDGSSCLNGWTCGNLATSGSDLAGALYNVFGLHPVTPLLSQSSLKQMTAVQPLTTGWSVGLDYGLGCMLANLFPDPKIDTKYTEVIGHAGQDYGSGAPLHFYNRALDVSVTLAVNSEYGMNCSLPDINENKQYSTIGCEIWSEIVTVASNGTVGPLQCRPLGENSPVPARRRHLLGGDTHCSSPDTKDVCYGASSRLAAEECFLWKSFHAGYRGEQWRRCHDKWQDPCACELVKCSDDGRHLLELRLSNNSISGFMNASTDLSAGSSLRHIDVSSNALFGVLPDLTKQLPKLAYLDISNNLFSAKLPALNFKQLSAGCSLNGNDFTCPLPPDAYASCDGGDLTCDAGLENFTSIECQKGLLKFYDNPSVKFWQGVLGTETAALSKSMGAQCTAELMANHTCHETLNWTKFESTVADYEKAVHKADPTGALCFLDNFKKQMVQGFGEIYWFVRKLTATPMSAACTPTERAKFLQYSARPSQCILQAQGAMSGCVYNFSSPATSPCTVS